MANAPTTPKPRYDSYWVICPWCGYEHGDGWEWATEYRETECDDCGKSFTVDPEYDVSYHTFVTGKEKGNMADVLVPKNTEQVERAFRLDWSNEKLFFRKISERVMEWIAAAREEETNKPVEQRLRPVTERAEPNAIILAYNKKNVLPTVWTTGPGAIMPKDYWCMGWIPVPSFPTPSLLELARELGDPPPLPSDTATAEYCEKANLFRKQFLEFSKELEGCHGPQELFDKLISKINQGKIP